MATDSPGWEFDKFDDGSLSKLMLSHASSKTKPNKDMEIARIKYNCLKNRHSNRMIDGKTLCQKK